MNISPFTSLPAETSSAQAADRSGNFDKLLKAAGAQPVSEKDSEQKLREKQANQAATGLVSTALIMPILAQVRRSTLNEKGPFSPGKAEKTFGPQFDMQLADRIAQSPRLGIKTALVRQILQRGHKAAPAGKGLNVNG